MEWKKSSRHLSFQDVVFLQFYNGVPPDRTMEYFAMSPFYDKQCNNEICRMQALSADRMRQMVGVEYVVDEGSP